MYISLEWFRHIGQHYTYGPTRAINSDSAGHGSFELWRPIQCILLEWFRHTVYIGQHYTYGPTRAVISRSAGHRSFELWRPIQCIFRSNGPDGYSVYIGQHCAYGPTRALGLLATVGLYSVWSFASILIMSSIWYIDRV